MQSLRNLETAFQKVRFHATVVVVSCCALTAMVCWWAFDYAKSSATRMYAVKNGVAVELEASTVWANREAEAKHHIQFYHDLMFNISPDQSSIAYNKKRAEFLGDKSLDLPYEQFTEKNFYNQVIGGNMRQEFRTDSIDVKMDTYPYQAILYGRITLYRATSRITKNLVTSCQLVDVSRSENNSNGFLMQHYNILESKKLSSEAR